MPEKNHAAFKLSTKNKQKNKTKNPLAQRKFMPQESIKGYFSM